MRVPRQLAFAIVVGAATALFVASPAAAHGIGGDAQDDSVLGFVWLGIKHMLLGWDHLLFITGVVLLAGNLRTAAKLITAFVVGHSLTLLLATIVGWKLDATLVDVVIALSLVYVGIQGVRGRPDDWRVVGAVVFGFGLVHGFGLSTRLQELGLPDDGMVARVFAFNVGVEIGQLLALTVIIGLGTLISRQLRDPNAPRRTIFGAIAGAGLIAAAILSFQGLREDPEDKQPVKVGTCEQTETSPPDTTLGAAHPPQSFYEPGQVPPDNDLTHVVGDGYVIVRYRKGLTVKEINSLATWVETVPDENVIAAEDPKQTAALRATTAYRVLTCPQPTVAEVRRFTEKWFEDLRAKRVP